MVTWLYKFAVEDKKMIVWNDLNMLWSPQPKEMLCLPILNLNISKRYDI